MNHNRFRTIFSRRLGMCIAVAEVAKGQGKESGRRASMGRPSSARVVSSMRALALALCIAEPMLSHAQSLPTGGQVQAGNANISQTGTTMNINQSSQRAVIDWNTFNVGQGNTVRFNQPNTQAQTLNRVTGAEASQIQGSLLANGQVLIQNANGVLFGNGAVVNVGALLATTKSIDANAFMAGDPLELKSTGVN
ncbi:filamentous hemagglutinin N-terminal domain-containing protein, partial [Pararobbsia silviterrae]